MAEQTNGVPNQRGTSSGEIGQNPVEIIGKHLAPSVDKPDTDPNDDQETGSKWVEGADKGTKN
jgi:hypothetical protein